MSKSTETTNDRVPRVLVRFGKHPSSVGKHPSSVGKRGGVAEALPKGTEALPKAKRRGVRWFGLLYEAPCPMSELYLSHHRYL